MEAQQKFTLEALIAIDADAAIGSAERRDYHAYQSLFQKLGNEAKLAGNESALSAYCLLSALCSMYLKQDNPRDPFGPMFVSEDCRGVIPNDLSQEILDVLAEYYTTVKDAELQARIADLLWIRLKKPEYLCAAVNAYIESAKVIEHPEHWSCGEARIVRAFRLAALQKKQNPALMEMVLAHIKSVLDKYNGTDPLFFSVSLIELLVENNQGEVEENYQRIFSIAQQARDDKNWEKAKQAWLVCESASRKIADKTQSEVITINKAETLAEQAIHGDQALVSAHWMQQAVEIYKTLPNHKARTAELYTLLREYQRASVDKMQPIQSPGIDISGEIKNTRQKMEGLSLENALFTLAFSINHVQNYAQIKENTIESTRGLLFSRLFGSMHMNREGLILAQVPPSLGIGDDENAKCTWANMMRSVKIGHELAVKAAIEPARYCILTEHHISDEIFYTYLTNNPFIRQGHEYLYSKGLFAGLNGDFATAAHLLIPQIESSLRYVLEQHGVETTILKEGVQEYWTLGKILSHEIIIEVLGEDIVYELQSLLIEKLYSNLRNEMAHGLVHAGHFFQPAVQYLWWLTLRLCLTPFYAGWNMQSEKQLAEEMHA